MVEAAFSLWKQRRPDDRINVIREITDLDVRNLRWEHIYDRYNNCGNL